MKAKQQTMPANAPLISQAIEYGNLGQNVRINDETKEERFKQFREIYYGRKNQSNSQPK